MPEPTHPIDVAESNHLDPPRDEAGRFTSEPQHFGREAELRDAGYTSLKDHEAAQEKVYPSTADGIEQATRDRAERLEAKPVEVDLSAEMPPELPPKVALSLAEAAERHAQREAAYKSVEAVNEHNKIGQQLADDLGVEFRLPDQQVEQPQPTQPAQPVETPEQAQQRQVQEAQAKIQADPVLRAALQEQFQTVQAHAQQYAQAAQAATVVAVQSTLREFPELQNIRADQLETAFELMSKQDPQKGARARAAVATAYALHGEAQRVQAEQARQQQQIAQAQFQKWGAAQDAAFVDMLPEFSRARGSARAAKRNPQDVDRGLRHSCGSAYGRLQQQPDAEGCQDAETAC